MIALSRGTIVIFVLFAGALAHADLYVTKVAQVRDIIVQHCAPQLPIKCDRPGYISPKQFKEVSKKIARMSTHLLVAASATIRAMPFAPVRLFQNYGTTRVASEELKALAKAPAGSVRIISLDPGAGEVMALFDEAAAAHAVNPAL